MGMAAKLFYRRAVDPPFGGTEKTMFKTICLAGLLAIVAGSVCVAASAGSSPELSHQGSAASLLPGAGLLVVGLFGRRKRLSPR
jgi:uncharacterized protein (TIGR03382 family)